MMSGPSRRSRTKVKSNLNTPGGGPIGTRTARKNALTGKPDSNEALSCSSPIKHQNKEYKKRKKKKIDIAKAGNAILKKKP